DIGSETRTDTGGGGGTSSRALSALTPIQGSLNGGTEITLTGTGFVSTMFATFGGRNCNGLNVVSETEATCFVPAGNAVGLVDVEIVWLDGTSSSLASAFDYLADGGNGSGNNNNGSSGGGSGNSNNNNTPPPADRPPAPSLQDVFLVKPAMDVTPRADQKLLVEAAVFWVDITREPGQAANVELEVGYGPISSDPSTTPENFTWVAPPYVYDDDGDGFNVGEGTHDHYQTELLADPGSYRVVARARFESGAWLYGDVSGRSDGFTPAELPVWTVQASE
ncbi:MAG: IPT/TIG domain-containing protein, partial [Myxococcota bacterium]